VPRTKPLGQENFLVASKFAASFVRASKTAEKLELPLSSGSIRQSIAPFPIPFWQRTGTRVGTERNKTGRNVFQPFNAKKNGLQSSFRIETRQFLFGNSLTEKWLHPYSFYVTSRSDGPIPLGTGFRAIARLKRHLSNFLILSTS